MKSNKTVQCGWYNPPEKSKDMKKKKKTEVPILYKVFKTTCFV